MSSCGRTDSGEVSRLLRRIDLREQDTLNLILPDSLADKLLINTTEIIFPPIRFIRVTLESKQATMQYAFEIDAYNESRDHDYTLPNQDVRCHEKHPPHPLIGIEWEPQVTLLNYPKMAVCPARNRDNNSMYMGKVADHTDAATLMGVAGMFLYLPKKYSDNIDNFNLEFRTPPVRLEDLPDAIKTEQDKMEALVKDIAKALGPTGIFLPALPCTKHVNISMPDWDDQLFKYNGCWKEGEYGARFHINVSYGFTEYDKLLKA